MDAARLQDKVYGGYAKAALRAGFDFAIYRPLNPPYTPPVARYALSPLNKVGTVKAAFSNANQTGFPFNKPNDYKSILWSGLFDGRETRPGDYLHSAAHGTYFVAAQQHLLPNLCVQCTNTFSVWRDNAQEEVGAVGFSGVSPANEKPMVYAFPGAMQWTRVGAHPVADLPSDLMRKGGWLFFLPTIPNVTLKERDVISDDQGRRFLAMSVYLSDLGYRILAEMLEAD